MLEAAGLLETVKPLDLIRAAEDLGKPLSVALDSLIAAVLNAEGQK